jgi:type II secretory pathway pseudopilin PulG
MLFGREAPRPFDARPSNGDDADSWLLKIRRAQEAVHEVARQRLQALHRQRDEALLANPPTPSFQPGDQVLIKDPTNTPGKSNKLKKRWINEAIIVKKQSDKVYRVRFTRSVALFLATSRVTNSSNSSRNSSSDTSSSAPNLQGSIGTATQASQLER